MFKSIKFWYGVAFGALLIMAIMAAVEGNWLEFFYNLLYIGVLGIAYWQGVRVNNSKAYGIGKALLHALNLTDHVHVHETSKGICIEAIISNEDPDEHQDPDPEPHEVPVSEEPEQKENQEPENPLNNLQPSEQPSEQEEVKDPDPEPPADPEPSAE